MVCTNMMLLSRGKKNWVFGIRIVWNKWKFDFDIFG